MQINKYLHLIFLSSLKLNLIYTWAYDIYVVLHTDIFININ